ncbi:hypothetical protein DJ533_12055 [Acinetobacter defluvii]|uniref:Uncharacterized protein n=1 Tax=Acinetobacter defluvii TaxID=1871111 RepID=A0A2S2FE55_9GAMM|nr:hypothetical protein [Acinetobacter defluvii]AWL29247.1 hypothetical protein DJ533_12055 [Acinetobacter defluvii]
MYILEEFKSSPLAEKITAISTAIIIVGISYKFGYYKFTPLTSGWVLPFFNLFDIAFSASKLIGIYISGLLILDKSFTSENGKQESQKIIFLIIIVCIVCYFLDTTVIDILSIAVPIISAILLVGFDGITKYIALALLIFISPFVNGLADIKNDLKYDALPTVVLKETKPIEDWRLLDKANEKILLINFRKKEEIKIVEFGEIEKIINKSPNQS